MRAKCILPALFALPVLAACTVGPLSGAKVVTSNEKEVVIVSDGFLDPFRTAGRECGRYGKKAILKGKSDETQRQVYYYDCKEP